jgi:hypothetical protein
VGSLAAITVNTGALNVTGNLTMSSTGAIIAGAGYGAAGGWFAGYSGGAYKFSLGNVLIFDGANLSLGAAAIHGAAFHTGSMTAYSWPAAGLTGSYLGPEGMLLGNVNTPGGFYFDISVAGGYLHMPWLSVDGRAVTLGSGDTSIVVNASGLLALNGQIVGNSNLNLGGFTATCSTTTFSYSLSYGLQYVGGLSVNAAGGVAPYSYNWAFMPASYGSRFSTLALTGANNQWVDVTAWGDNATLTGTLVCFVRDNNGRVAIGTCTVSLTFSSSPDNPPSAIGGGP